MTTDVGGKNVVIGTLIGFEIVCNEGCDDEYRLTYTDAKEALTSEEGNVFYRQLRLSSGEVVLDEGIELGGGEVVGSIFYGKSCSKCPKLIWSRTNDPRPALCADCNVSDVPVSDGERFDREY